MSATQGDRLAATPPIDLNYGKSLSAATHRVTAIVACSGHEVEVEMPPEAEMIALLARQLVMAAR